MVIDSIQVMHLADIQSSPGSVSQVRECASYLTRYAKMNQVAIIMVGHVTKDGTLAGPKVLETLYRLFDPIGGRVRFTFSHPSQSEKSFRRGK